MSLPTSNIRLRSLVLDDLVVIFPWWSRAGGEELLRRQEHGVERVVVAEIDGHAAGRVSLNFERFADERAAYLWAAHVEPAYRSRGLGTALMLEAENVARDHGFKRLRLAVGKENRRAERFYERLGYLRDGEELQRWSTRDGDEVVEVVEDCWTMRKDLADG